MSCLPTYKVKRYNSLEELYKANGVNPQQKLKAQQAYFQYVKQTGKQDIQGFKEFVTPVFDKQLTQKIQDKLEKLYPEIKLNITNNPVWEQGDNIFNQEEFNNQVNYRLKATEILLSDKAKQVFAKGEKVGWDLNKILTELQVPKEQKQLILDLGITNREQLALELASNYSYAVEVNTALKPIQSSDEFAIMNEIEGYPTQHYSNLTVPGGTNYTEQEISTPLIIPSIKGHAQFSTDKGIGWFRSDEQTKEKQFVTETLKDGSVKMIDRGVTPTKTRRILEVQSDLFQKGRDKKDLVGKDRNNELTTSFELNLETYNKDTLRNYTKFLADPFGTEREIAITEKEYKDAYRQKYKTDYIEDKTSTKENQFLQLLNKSNNWVTFFIKSIIQDSAKKGYEKVLFPKGDTAAKIEGHETLEEFKKQKEDRIKELEKERDDLSKREYKIGDYFNKYQPNFKPIAGDNKIETQEEVDEMNNQYILGAVNDEINQLKQELTDVESGQTQLSSIAKFYETTIFNILKKQGYNPIEVTDEYGNKWNETSINQVRDLANVLLQRNEANQIIGQANIKAMTVLVDAINQKQDTLPHEYAHHYIAMFRDNAIVQEGIKKWGSEEALVQSIGEQVVLQKGEALNWWNNFVKWIMDKFNSLSKLEKQELTQILTDAFLTRQDLGSKRDTQGFKEFVEGKELTPKQQLEEKDVINIFIKYHDKINKDKLNETTAEDFILASKEFNSKEELIDYINKCY